ncbi:GTPase-activating protein S13 [Chytridiales sp. JEL 0842]|nr:GTPase-activating protein S13 [Chytridiales sp. JEL 0842]
MAQGSINFDTLHEDMIHDAQLDYYGKKLATCSSDRTVRIFEVENDGHRQLEVLKGHEGPVWQVAWAHPKFGTILASCSYDAKVIIWRELNGAWTRVKDHVFHTSSEDGTWDVVSFNAHSIGVNAVSWAPATIPGSLITTSGSAAAPVLLKRFASGGCDNMVKIWREENGTWKEEAVLNGHSDWVRDVSWAPNIGLPASYLASCSQDKTVVIWTQDSPSGSWTKKPLKAEPFADVLWRVSWSTSGNILAVSCGDNKVTMWKESLDGEYAQIADVEH